MAGVELAWAVEAELGGVTYRHATRRLEVDGLAFAPGLDVPAQSRLVTSMRAPIPITITSRDRWGDSFKAAQWLVDGGLCRLFLCISEAGTWRRELWQEGRVERTRWGAQGSPLKFDLQSGGEGLMLDPTYKINSLTLPKQITVPPPTNSWELQERMGGQFYNLVLGYPGSLTDKTVICCVPCATMQVALKEYTLSDASTVELIEYYAALVGSYEMARRSWDGNADPHVDVLELGLKDLEADDQETAIAQYVDALEYTEDLYGRPLAYVWNSGGTVRRGDAPETWVGFRAPSAAASGTGGGGVVEGSSGGEQYRGGEVRGLASVFEWLMKTRTTYRFDDGAHRANADVLDKYKVDTWINAQCDPEGWFRELLSVIPTAAVVRGPGGFSLAFMPLQPTGEAVEVTIEEGRNASRDGDLEVRVPDANQVTVRSGEARGMWNRTVTYTAENRLPQILPGGRVYYDTSASKQFIAVVGQEVHGVRALQLDLDFVWDAATAEQIGIDHLWDRGLPRRTVAYQLGPEYTYLRPGQQVRLIDAELGIDHVSRLDDVRVDPMSGQSVRVVVRPLKDTTAYL